MTAEKTSVDQTAEVEVTAADVAPAEDIDSAGDTGGNDKSPGRPKRIAARAGKLSSGRILAAVLALLVVASLALLGGLFWFQYRPDRATDAAAAKAAISAASEGTIAVLSYSPDTLDHDFSSAKSHLTGDFLSYYDQFTQQIVAPAAKQKSVKTTAVVLRAAVSELHPDSAVVLLFVNQSTQSKDRPEPTFTNSSVSVTLTKAHDKWLISSFNPV
ncbi:twin-arginine translocation pathway signal [Mycobacterium helveticum]|uniref:Twin-arginine translocation pathway signal n=1 Tax=Mycobacterium helveticum TaxID=2592811 RepID=A0A557XSD1_9MYCO|nr:twin-arginine translocation pathway signal [Mycobacterium helveticum]TVS88875.1 twin-arginine translocation pathway signal [Mycobacterium helveticum]